MPGLISEVANTDRDEKPSQAVVLPKDDSTKLP